MMHLHQSDEHQAGVATQAAPVGTTTLAYCSCGWREVHTARIDPQRAADAHDGGDRTPRESQVDPWPY